MEIKFKKGDKVRVVKTGMSDSFLNEHINIYINPNWIPFLL